MEAFQCNHHGRSVIWSQCTMDAAFVQSIAACHSANFPETDSKQIQVELHGLLGKVGTSQ